MSKLKLIWENNPDTALSASNLSRNIIDYTNENILYLDNDNFIDNSDGLLKIRANTKFSANTEVTTAFFNFNDSLISHNSKYSPFISENINYRYETPYSSGKSIALETGTINFISNANFENDLTDWTIDTVGSTSINISNNGLYGNKCVNFQLGSGTVRAEINQSVQLTETTSANDNKNISISFYYKSDKELNLSIGGNLSGDSPKYWNDILQAWSNSELSAIKTISPSSNWKRVEIDNIRTDSIFNGNNVTIKLFADQENSNYYIDAVQIEEKDFCSSFTIDNRDETSLNYYNNLMRLEKGTIDLEFIIKNFNVKKNILLQLKMTEKTDTFDTNKKYTDALRIEFDATNSLISFVIFDVVQNKEVKINKTLSSIVLDAFINKWHRLVVAWDSNSPYMKISLDSSQVESSTLQYTIVDNSELQEIKFGGEGAIDPDDNTKLEGLISSIKFNIFPKSNDDMITESQEQSVADDLEYKIFVAGNEAIVINESLLNEDSSFQPSTEYYIYISDDEGELEELDIIVSNHSDCPIGYNYLFVHQIGGFKTNSNGEIDASTIWDLKTKNNPTIMTERLIVHGENSETNNIEFRSFPYNDVNDATFNVSTLFTNHVYGNNNFLDIDPIGLVKIDNVKIDNNIITSINNNDLIITAPTTYKVQINADNTDINSMNGGFIQLDDVHIQGSTVRAPLTKNLILTNDMTNPTSEVKISSNNGISRIIGTTHINDASNITLNGVNTIIQPSTTTQINSGTTPIYLDNISFDDYTITTKDSNLHLTSPTQIQIDQNVAIVDTKKLTFNGSNGQKISLNNSNTSGIGQQNSATYFRTNSNFAWYEGGTHNDTFGDAGGGTVLAALTDGDFSGTINSNSKFYAGRVYNAVWNDIAECWIKKVGYDIEYGQVMVQTEHGIRPSEKRAEKAVVGIASNTYGYLLGQEGFNEDLTKSNKIPIGIVGRVKVSCIGKFSIGDEVVSYKGGKIIRANWFEKIFKRDRIIGQVDSIFETYCWIKIR